MHDENVHADWSKLRLLAPIGAALVLAGLVAAALLATLGSGDASPAAPTAEPLTSSTAPVDDDPAALATAVLDEFVVALERGRLDGLEFAFTDAAAAGEEYRQLVADLGPVTIDVRPGPLTIVDPANATAPIEVDWTLEDGTTFTTVGEADLALLATVWRVDWEPAILEISLDPGDALVRQRVMAPRAPILGRDGVALIDNRPVVDVGVIPRQAGDIGPLSETIGPLIGRDPADILAQVAPSPSDATVILASLTAEEVAPIEAGLRALPGVVLEPSVFPLPPEPRFARALLGRSAEVTREILDEHPDLFVVGDIAGRSGLQRQYNARLTGLPGFEIRVRRRFPTPIPAEPPTTAPATTSGGSPADQAGSGSADPSSPTPTTSPVAPPDPDVIYREDPTPGRALQLTIDARVQRAAEDALARTELTSALVAVQPSTGHVLAVANGPGMAVDNLAMTGQYPPGSVFKTVTAYAALAQGFGPDDPVDCPLTLEVDGRSFANAEGEVLGTVPLRQAFVLSCNTAFINLAAVLDPSDFSVAAARFGIGVGYDLGTPAYSGSVPTPDGAVDKAATSFGQGRVLVSPLSAAVLAATAAAGTYRPPSLVIEPDQPAPDGQPLDGAAAAELQRFMREVVTGGTGRAVAGVPGGPVSGKTGTAEYGDAVPPEAHAWFVGFQNDLAFAVFVAGGEFGGATAAPIAADFLGRLAG
jgi:cell division protein FtsI/penicillin-binding protein 2